MDIGSQGMLIVGWSNAVCPPLNGVQVKSFAHLTLAESFVIDECCQLNLPRYLENTHPLSATPLSGSVQTTNDQSFRFSISKTTCPK